MFHLKDLIEKILLIEFRLKNVFSEIHLKTFI